MTLVGASGAAVLNFFGKRRLAVGSDTSIPIELNDAAGSDVDLSIYDGGFTGAGRRERNEVLTTAPLFQVTAAFTTPPGTGATGLLTLSVAGSQLGQDTPARGYYDLFGIITGTPNTYTLLVTGRWECIGGTVDPANPVAG